MTTCPISRGRYLITFLIQIFTVSANLWLTVWSGDESAATDISKRNFYLAIYGVLGFLEAFFIMLGVLAVTVGTLRASVRLHTDLMNHILSSTMAWFDTTPTGRIINRFSKDIDEVDLMIPMHVKDILNQVFAVIASILVIVYANPIILVVVVPMIAIFFIVQTVYLNFSRQCKRMVSVSRSPINSCLTESFSGASTIRFVNSIIMWKMNVGRGAKSAPFK
jgi:ATP-binding cassette subfamily C (CFTR/MRP) protein 1